MQKKFFFLLIVFFIVFSKVLFAVDDPEPYVQSISVKDNVIELRSKVCVTVVNFSQLKKEVDTYHKNIVLYLDNIPLEGIYAYETPLKDKKDIVKLNFFINHTESPIKVWNKLALVRDKEELFSTFVTVSVGIEGREAIPTNVENYKLILADKLWFLGCMGIIIILLLIVIYFAIKSSVLRVTTSPSQKYYEKPFNLVYVQLAAWTYVIVSSWLFLYIIKHTFNTITESLLVLMGINSLTTVGSITISANKKTKPKKTIGFWKDIVVDENACFSLHRFQMIVWTVVLMVVFIRQVYCYFAMPEFDSNLLVLMGITSGTYLSLKSTEKSEALAANNHEVSESKSSKEPEKP